MLSVKKFNNISDRIYENLPKEEYAFLEENETGAYDMAIVRSKELTEENFPAGLFAIARAGAGYNNIPVDRATEQGIVVFNTPGANANAVKELVLAGLLLAGRNVIGGNEWLKAQHAEGQTGVDKTMEKAKKNFVGREVKGKRLGVIGLGAIGVKVANAATGLEMEVLGFDPFLSVNAALSLERNVKLAKDIDEIFKTCDYITIHVPQNEQTKNTVRKEKLEMMKEDVVILNFARGGLVMEDDLIEALESGKVGAYVTDFPTDRLLGVRNVIAFPHLGASTPEAEENCAEMAAKELDQFARFGTIKNSVNFPTVEMPFEGGVRLAIINKNVTNMLGQITAVLASDGFNVDHMLNRSKGEYAYTLIDVPSMPDEKTLSEIRAIEGIVRLRVIEQNEH